MEFSSLGKNCYKCNNLDFLPVFCTKCNQFYCKDHYKKNKHNCVSDNDDPYNVNLLSESNDKKESIYKYNCNYRKCKTKEIIELKCRNCNKTFCKKHHYLEIHKCINKENKNEVTEPLINTQNKGKNKKKYCFIQ